MSQTEPRIIAHRGFAGVAPENTLPAFEEIAKGTHEADLVEVDVIPCADGAPVVFHDTHLDDRGKSRGITDGSGPVWETPCPELRTLSVLDTGAGIPPLEAVFDVLPPDIGVNVELKNPGTVDLRSGEPLDPGEVDARREQWDPFVERVLDVVSERAHEVLVSSFHEPALAAVRDLAPEMPIGVLLHSVGEGLTIADRYAAEAIHPPVALLPGTPYFDPESGSTPAVDEGTDLVTAAAERDLSVNVWTVTSWHEAAWMAKIGVDGVITDYPGVLDGPAVSP